MYSQTADTCTYSTRTVLVEIIEVKAHCLCHIYQKLALTLESGNFDNWMKCIFIWVLWDLWSTVNVAIGRNLYFITMWLTVFSISFDRFLLLPWNRLIEWTSLEPEHWNFPIQASWTWGKNRFPSSYKPTKPCINQDKKVSLLIKNQQSKSQVFIAGLLIKIV